MREYNSRHCIQGFFFLGGLSYMNVQNEAQPPNT